MSFSGQLLEQSKDQKKSEHEKKSKQITVKAKFNNTVINTMHEINKGPHNYTEGVWYSNDFYNYCLETKQEFQGPKNHFMHGFANPDYWEVEGHQFTKKPGISASAALKSFLKGLTIADCGNMLVAAQYAGLLAVLGEKKFDLLFSFIPMVIGQLIYDHTFKNPISCLFECSSIPKGSIGHRLLPKGAFCYIFGVPEYPEKHPGGHLNGFNLVCVGQMPSGEELFLGFGSEIFKEGPLTEEQIRTYLLQAYNSKRTVADDKVIEMENKQIRAYLNSQGSESDKIKVESSNYPEIAEASVLRGFYDGYVFTPNIKAIKKLKHSKNIQKDFLDIMALHIKGRKESISNHYFNIMNSRYKTLCLKYETQVLLSSQSFFKAAKDPATGQSFLVKFALSKSA